MVPKCRLGPITSTLFTIFLSLCALFWIENTAQADTASYTYDNLGRLVSIINGGNYTSYTYDEVGNVVATSTGTTAAAAPAVTSITPSTLLVGVKTNVQIVGQNLLTTQSVTSTGGSISFGPVTASDTVLSVDMTATAAGTDNIVVSTRFGNSQPLQVTTTGSALVLAPLQMAVPLGGTGSMSASLSPPLATPVTISIPSSNPTIAAVPGTVTIPAGGSAAFYVNGYKEGTVFLPGLNQPNPSEVFVPSKVRQTLSCSSPLVSVGVNPLPLPSKTPLTLVSGRLSLAIDQHPQTTFYAVSNRTYVSIATH
jgi:YD repeat-containing protein